MKSVQIQAYSNSNLIKNSPQGPLDLVNIASMIHTQQPTLKKYTSMCEYTFLIEEILNMGM